MNRQKKLQNRFNQRLRKAKAKLNPNSKPKYISKADREKLALTQQNETDEQSC